MSNICKWKLGLQSVSKDRSGNSPGEIYYKCWEKALSHSYTVDLKHGLKQQGRLKSNKEGENEKLEWVKN